MRLDYQTVPTLLLVLTGICVLLGLYNQTEQHLFGYLHLLVQGQQDPVSCFLESS